MRKVTKFNILEHGHKFAEVYSKKEANEYLGKFGRAEKTLHGKKVFSVRKAKTVNVLEKGDY